jgi:hypothetical protein
LLLIATTTIVHDRIISWMFRQKLCELIPSELVDMQLLIVPDLEEWHAYLVTVED